MEKIIIAIDGFSSCGKSTMAKDLAHELGRYGGNVSLCCTLCLTA